MIRSKFKPKLTRKNRTFLKAVSLASLILFNKSNDPVFGFSMTLVEVTLGFFRGKCEWKWGEGAPSSELRSAFYFRSHGQRFFYVLVLPPDSYELQFYS